MHMILSYICSSDFFCRTKPTWKQAYLTFVYGLLGGSLYHNLCLASLNSASATFVTGIINVTPIITLVLGLIVRRNSKSLESLAYGTCAGKIKLVGIMLSISGVMLLAFFKRVEININVSPTKFSLLPQHYHRSTRDHNDQVLGLVLAIIAAFSNACFLTIQAKFKEDTQNIYLIPFMMNLMGAIQGVVYALGVERDWEQWKLGWNIRFWASSFGGVFGSGLTTTLITWCISKTGPLFVSTFNPIGLILMALVGSLVLQETLYLTRTKPTRKQAYLTFVYGLLGLESLAYGTCAGKIKLVGIMLSISGVMLLAFFKRVEININVSPTKFSLLPQNYHRSTRDHNDQVLGLVLAIIAAFSNACFLTIQAKFKEDTQNIYLIPFMMNLMGAIQGVVYALGVERDWEQWKLGWNIRFWASSFVGVIGSGLTTTLITWCINSEMGPLFVSTFNPVGLILMALVGSLVLQETLYVTSVAAIVLIIAATFLVLYGKLKEMENTNVNYQSEGSGRDQENEDEVVD
ncbi:WAT1-related protein At1g25270-like isoform X2 [Rhododendron vialii]|uniref:WAT1-related protein At1g25270-like isoform X2 n=1 Tax=Rhododendron vialii TaxID=182163 RepID=UPI00265D6477|nr:WAT1-related protein At1g25270-like isoform X2 [Rhododendron vialii]